MRNHVATLSALTLAALLLAGCTGERRAPAGAVRIMPLGDSITQAARGRDSWRRELWLALREAGHEVDFVGSRRRNHLGPSANRDFDTDHEGHWGWRADEILAGLDKWLPKHKPDIVLLHIGTNDLGSSERMETVVEDIRGIIVKLREHNPEVILLLARLIPRAHPVAVLRIRELNEEIDALGRTLTSEASPIVIVDQYEGFDARRDTYDGLHPNETGNAKMAKKWFEALMAVL